MSEIYLIAGMALVTFLIRYTMFAVGGRFVFPPFLERALNYVPPAVLTAITVPAVLIPDGEALWLSYQNSYLVGALCAFAIGWWSRNLLLTIVFGMFSFLVWQYLF